MANAWGHTVRELTNEEIQKQINSGKNWYQWGLKHIPEKYVSEEKLIHSERKCRISNKCNNESTHLLTYHYITGRAGRISFVEKPICKVHAEKYLRTTGLGAKQIIKLLKEY